MHGDWYATSIILDCYRAVTVDAYSYMVTKSGQSFINGIINQFVDQVVKPGNRC